MAEFDYSSPNTELDYRVLANPSVYPPRYDLRKLKVIDDELEDEKDDMVDDIKDGSLYRQLLTFIYKYGDNPSKELVNRIIGVKSSPAVITGICEAKTAGRYVANYNPDHLYAHVSAVAGVKIESNGYYITPGTSKFVNLNGDSWDVGLLRKKASDFVNAFNFYEHKYEPSNSKGAVLDIMLKESDETLYVDALIEVTDPAMKHKVANREVNSVSIGCVYSFVTCTQCGKRFKPEEARCSHLANNLRGKFTDENGLQRVVSELTGHVDHPSSVKFYEISWVGTPAFCGAVLWDFVNDGNNKKSASAISDGIDRYFRIYMPYVSRYFKTRSLSDRLFYMYMCFMTMAYLNRSHVFNMLRSLVGLRYNMMVSKSYYEDYFKRFGLRPKEVNYLVELVDEYGRVVQ